MASCSFTVWCNYHHCLVPKHFLIPKGNPISSHFLFPPPPALTTTNLLSVSRDLPVLDTSYKGDHTYMGFCAWLLLLGVMSFRFLCAVAYFSTAFLINLLWPEPALPDTQKINPTSFPYSQIYFHLLALQSRLRVKGREGRGWRIVCARESGTFCFLAGV